MKIIAIIVGIIVSLMGIIYFVCAIYLGIALAKEWWYELTSKNPKP